MRHCLFCDTALPASAPGGSAKGRRVAYDPVLGRLWDVCPKCHRWSPVPLDARWEVVVELEERARRDGEIVLEGGELSLVRIGDEEVVRVGDPPAREWGGWRYGMRIAMPVRHPSFFARILEGLPSPPLEGYDPYGLSGPMGGVGGRAGPSEWLASPFLEGARPLTLAFTSFPFAPACPSCGREMALYPWDFQEVTLREMGRETGVEARCAHCARVVTLDLRDARPAIRMGLALLDSGPDARRVGESAGEALGQAGGRAALLRGLGRAGTALGDLERVGRVTLGIALDEAAESDALEAQWREAEEVAELLERGTDDSPDFREFRARVLGRFRP